MNGNKQTGLTHLHVYTFVIYRTERGTVACIIITACRSLRKIYSNSPHAFSVNFNHKSIKMEAHIQALRINRNPLNLVLGTKRKLGLRIGYMEAALKGFYLNSIETGVHPQKLTRLLSEEFHCVDTESTNGLLQFLTNEGDRVPYQIMLPYLLSSDNINEFETIIHKRFFGVERFVRQGNNLYRFVKYTEERRDPIIWINDLERGIDAWDMGMLVNLARAAYEIGYITKGQAWEHIEQAGILCSEILRSPEEIDKSFLLGRAMQSEKIEDWDRLLSCYLLLNKHR